jgi:hypothetical protein
LKLVLLLLATILILMMDTVLILAIAAAIANGVSGSTEPKIQPKMFALIVMMFHYATKSALGARASLCMKNMVSRSSLFTVSYGKPIQKKIEFVGIGSKEIMLRGLDRSAPKVLVEHARSNRRTKGPKQLWF